MDTISAKMFKKKFIVPEKAEQSSGLEFLARIGIFAYRANSGVATYTNKDNSQRRVRYGIKGLSDIVGVIPKDKCGSSHAIPLYWEFKRSDKKPTPQQKEFIDSRVKEGCFSGWGTCSDIIDECKRWGFI